MAAGHYRGVNGRGARSNRSGRFERHSDTAFDDGWGTIEDDPSRPHTKVLIDRARTAIRKNDSPDVPFDRSVNPYQGCEHGCVYCFARPTHAYYGRSAGLEFETDIFAKPNLPDLLRRELARRGYRADVLALGSNTDPYQPVEARLGITRAILEVLAEHRHPVSIVTKSASILRDADLIAELAARRLAHVYMSVTTLDSQLARSMEPRASAPERRLRAIEALAARGVPVGVLAAPMIPGLNDSEVEAILEAAAAAGAGSAGYVLLRLAAEIGPLFDEWLAEHYPDRRAKVLSLVRDTRGGRLYRAEFGERMRGTGPHAELLARRFERARRSLGLAHRPDVFDRDAFRVPDPAVADGQLGLFA